MDVLDRLADKVLVGDGCWDWIGGCTGNGYGAFVPELGGPQVRAHRFVYELLVGPIPAGLQLDHLCRRRRCVRPGHLEPVTEAENHARTALVRCCRGHEFTDENTYRVPAGPRQCRACRLEHERRRPNRYRTDPTYRAALLERSRQRYRRLKGGD